MASNSVGGSRSRGSSCSYSSHIGVAVDDDPKYCGCGVLLHTQTPRTKKKTRAVVLKPVQLEENAVAKCSSGSMTIFLQAHS
ncbi:hypothetical protein BUALT_Bualt15G0112000 [Buddleja alternifolia]|uniref:Uncharacterized protein n=1 Tax=Buddleja alternifolia TaxID=168488 RepID=A0AAV6WPZ3_9LAMI|nr:hypothetical protein BUALT_Bualt15G0112000 [Buddleja alternifolia]